MDQSSIRLTQTVKKGGCAAKIAAVDLRKILSHVRFPNPDSNLLIDGALFDDAAIYKISEELSLVQTLDFFTPIVDTPKLFGRISAANALSDVYAMGGEPKTTMAILAFPITSLDPSIAVDILQGASDVIREAEACLVGGHSIDDETIKFGLSVTGYVDTTSIWSNSKCRLGDTLILTKSLGTGTLTAGLKRNAWSEQEISDAIVSMGQINRTSDLLNKVQRSAIHSATDITGFGFAGHAMQMAQASNVSFKIQYEKLPVFQKTIQSLTEGFLTKAHRSNREYVQARCDFSKFSDKDTLVLFDPQTSGGLLLSVNPSEADETLQRLRKRFPSAQIVGEVVERSEQDWILI